MSVIRRLGGLEILDSRGRPTVRATCQLDDGTVAHASVPSGASTGSAEACELRDGDPDRYEGLGCRQAVRHIEQELQTALADRPFDEQRDLDEALIAEDGTPDKSRLGANALLAVSLAFCRAQALQRKLPLYRHFGGMIAADASAPTLPRPIINLFSGGKHAGGQTAIQDLLIVPAAAPTIDEALAISYSVYQSAARLVLKRYGMRLLRADEGGLAPPVRSVEELLDLAVEAILAARYEPGQDLMLGIDVASSHFYRDARYHLDERSLTAGEMIKRLEGWVEGYPIVSVEDGLAEDDWEHWPRLAERIRGRALVVGDDLLCTNPARIERAAELGAADTLLLKVNQVGTLSEAADACALARRAGWRVTVSARSGETEDDWLADLAVGWRGDQTKIGSITQSERLAKYNRLLEIEAAERLPIVGWPGR